MRCEVCGQKIRGKPVRVIIEGAKLTVCNECSKHGTVVWEEPKQPLATPKLKAKITKPAVPSKVNEAVKNRGFESTLELVEGFDVKIRQARENMGLTHEELGKKINEKVSVLKKIEVGKMTPDNRLAAKLEHALKIKLLISATEEKASEVTVSKLPSRELTLGDLFKINKGKAEEKT